ncbi:MAG: hypothetical protein JWO67_3826 [Streptosporangiaceae bacterium]|nr:hypothetical protein [Streptosporangiaceae bacterium]
MGRREVVHVTLREGADPDVSPNATIGQVSVDLRVAFPPHMDHGDVVVAIRRAAEMAIGKLVTEVVRS